jgi:hypothetical protein
MYESYTNSATKYSDKMKAQEEEDNPANSSIMDPNRSSTDATVPAQGKSTSSNLLDNIFNKTSVFYLILFLGIYIVLYFLLGVFFNKGGDVSSFQLKLSRTLDFIFFGFIILFIVSYLYSGNVDTLEASLLGGFSDYSTFITAPTSIITMILFLIVFYVIIYLFRIPTESDIKPFCVSIIETVAWLTFIIIGILYFFQYVLGMPIQRMFAALWNNLPNQPVRDSSNNIVRDNSNNIVVDNSNNIVKNEVFNISNNLYTYDDAQSICTAYGAKLATYDQMEEAYNNGAEWCNYGWSDGQMIFFPTQKSTWQELQKDPKKKNNCGRPGVNGGFIQNPYVKFGVNCFGKKPQPNADDLARLNAQNIPASTPEDAELDAKVQYWKDNAANLLQINSYNKKQWSEY